MDNCVLFFVKWPEAGSVKSRLGKGIGMKAAANVYSGFVTDVLEKLDKIEASVVVCFDPLEKTEDFRQWLGEKNEYSVQVGSDLGERMKNSFVEAFSNGYNKAILVGSDIPELPASIISRAFEVLKESDATIGPTIDGGYYLIGFRKDSFRGDVFDDIEWSTSSVFVETMKKFGSDYLVSILDKLQDVDTAEDYQEYLERNAEDL